MPAKGSDDLYKLIHSLSPSEKGYFKKFADRYSFSEQNNYLKLFEAIESQKEYDEKKLLKESYVNQLPRQKNYLQGLILKSLQVQYADELAVTQIENSIQHIRILTRRKLYDQARKLIIKLKKLALENDLFTDALKIVKFEESLNKISGVDRKHDIERSFYEERNKIIALEKDMTDIQELEQQVIMFMREDYSKTSALKNKLLAGDHKPLSLKSQIIYYSTLAIYNNCLKNFEKQYVYANKCMKLKRKEFRILREVHIFVPGFINYFFACYSNQRFSECAALIAELKKIPVKNDPEHNFRQGVYFFLYSYLFLGTGKFEAGSTFAKEEFEKQLKDHHFTSPWMLAETTKNITLIYLANKQYKDCLKWVNILVTGSSKDNAPFIYYQSLLINIMVHYELGNKETAGHLILSARRILKNNNKLTSLEDLFLSFFKKYLLDESNKALLSETIQKIKAIKNESNYHSHTSGYSYCLSWLESKLQKKPFSDVVKEKAKKDSGKNYWK